MPELHIYDVVLRPVITEKSSIMSEDHNPVIKNSTDEGVKTTQS